MYPFFQVDSFTGERFAGNPAAVVFLDAWPADDVLQAVAAENNLSETAFLVKRGDDYELRWFTPTVEVDLCGHATLAAGHVVFTHLERDRQEVVFHTRSGALTVSQQADDRLSMDFPACASEVAHPPDMLFAAMGRRPREVHRASWTWLLTYADEATIRALEPDFVALRSVEPASVIATAPGTDCDFVSRFFGPGVGVDEDPVTGSAHCVLAPYWAKRLEKSTFLARQVSARGGEMTCDVRGDRVVLGGRVTPYLEGHIEI
ncbi:MAG: PhzF family phenazine biosynthesis protein [Planctomycetota bacterium]|jgi:PhzF family phenazine biosynthesis protein